MKKLAITLSIAFAVFLVILATKVVYADYTRQAEWQNDRRIITIRVQSGDTVDGYWAEYAPDWMGREQYRKEWMELNRTHSCSLRRGDKVLVYAE